MTGTYNLGASNNVYLNAYASKLPGGGANITGVLYSNITGTHQQLLQQQEHTAT